MAPSLRINLRRQCCGPARRDTAGRAALVRIAANRLPAYDGPSLLGNHLDLAMKIKEATMVEVIDEPTPEEVLDFVLQPSRASGDTLVAPPWQSSEQVTIIPKVMKSNTNKSEVEPEERKRRRLAEADRAFCRRL